MTDVTTEPKEITADVAEFRDLARRLMAPGSTDREAMKHAAGVLNAGLGTVLHWWYGQRAVPGLALRAMRSQVAALADVDTGEPITLALLDECVAVESMVTVTDTLLVLDDNDEPMTPDAMVAHYRGLGFDRHTGIIFENDGKIPYRVRAWVEASLSEDDLVPVTVMGRMVSDRLFGSSAAVCVTGSTRVTFGGDNRIINQICVQPGSPFGGETPDQVRGQTPEMRQALEAYYLALALAGTVGTLSLDPYCTATDAFARTPGDFILEIGDTTRPLSRSVPGALRAVRAAAARLKSMA